METDVELAAVVETWLPEVLVGAWVVVLTVPLELTELDEVTVARVVEGLVEDEALLLLLLGLTEELDELLLDEPPLPLFTTLMLCQVPLRSEYWYSVASVAPWPPM